jgi:hypothetical protein
LAGSRHGVGEAIHSTFGVGEIERRLGELDFEDCGAWKQVDPRIQELAALERESVQDLLGELDLVRGRLDRADLLIDEQAFARIASAGEQRGLPDRV